MSLFYTDDVTQKQLLVDPHQSRDLNLRPRPTTRFLADENVEDYANSLACGFCKQNLTVGDEGIIESPNYPDAYTANVNCLWLLETADLDDRIVLHCDTIELGKLQVTLASEASYIFSIFQNLAVPTKEQHQNGKIIWLSHLYGISRKVGFTVATLPASSK